MRGDEFYGALIDLDNIRKACRDAYIYRSKSKAFVSPSDLLDYYEDTLVSRIFNRLTKDFVAKSKIGYYVPKNVFCGRMYSYIEFEDLAIWFAIIRVITIKKAFLTTLNSDGSLNTKDFWASNLIKAEIPLSSNKEEEITQFDFDLIIQTDISAFYHSISIKKLLQILSDYLSIQQDCKFIQLVKSLLKSPTLDARNGEKIYLSRGLPIGNFVDDYLAQMYLNGVVKKIIEKNNSIIHMENFIDDFAIFVKLDSNDSSSTLVVRKIIYDLGIELAKLDLTLNHSKTIVNSMKAINSITETNTSWFIHKIEILAGDLELRKRFIEANNLREIPLTIVNELDVKRLIICLLDKEHIELSDVEIILQALLKFPREIFAYFLVEMLPYGDAWGLIGAEDVSEFIKTAILRKYILLQQNDKYRFKYDKLLAEQLLKIKNKNLLLKEYIDRFEQIRFFEQD